MITACNCKIFSTRYEDDTIMNIRAESMLIFLNERFFFNSDRGRFGMTLQTELHALRSNFYAAFLRCEFGGFYRLCFDYFSFSRILKG